MHSAVKDTSWASIHEWSASPSDSEYDGIDECHVFHDNGTAHSIEISVPSTEYQDGLLVDE